LVIDFLTQTLGIPDIRAIRELLDREPGLNARDIAPRSVQHTLDLPADDEDDDHATLL
jgi:hypothetical protein